MTNPVKCLIRNVRIYSALYIKYRALAIYRPVIQRPLAIYRPILFSFGLVGISRMYSRSSSTIVICRPILFSFGLVGISRMYSRSSSTIVICRPILFSFGLVGISRMYSRSSSTIVICRAVVSNTECPVYGKYAQSSMHATRYQLGIISLFCLENRGIQSTLVLS